MAANAVKLLGFWASPNVNRVQIALNLKSVSYEFIEENLRSKSELLLKSNPVHKKVPVLIHGDRPIAESLVILQYIDQVWADAPSILPSDPYDRAVARFWAAYIDNKVCYCWLLLLLFSQKNGYFFFLWDKVLNYCLASQFNYHILNP